MNPTGSLHDRYRRDAVRMRPFYGGGRTASLRYVSGQDSTLMTRIERIYADRKMLIKKERKNQQKNSNAMAYINADTRLLLTR